MKKLLLTAMVAIVFSGSVFAQINSSLYESHWSDFNSGPYETLDAVVAFFKINGEYITADEWESMEIAAYVDGECRGHSFLTEDGDLHPYTELCIYRDDSIMSLNKEVSFRLYDHAEEIEYVIPNSSILTGEDHVEIYLGNYNNAVVLNFEQNVLTFNLIQGWNRVSTFIEVDDPVTTLDVLKTSLGENGITIEAPNSSTDYYEDYGWWGGLDDIGINNEEMYLILVSEDCSVELQGMPANPTNHPIIISSGWNRIGFPYLKTMQIEDALANFEAEAGDIIESANGQVMYYEDYGWWGDFDEFTPGHGYMYYSASSEEKTLIFVPGAKARGTARP